MKESQYKDDYYNFPYQKDLSEGRTNNGSFDLLNEPWRIDEISEAAKFPELYRFLKDLNHPESSFITLGCDAGFWEGCFTGYVEISFRCAAVATNLSFVTDLDSQFYAWASRNSQELENFSRQALAWEYAWFSFYNNPKQLKVCIFFETAIQNDAGRLLEAIGFYLQRCCELPI